MHSEEIMGMQTSAKSRIQSSSAQRSCGVPRSVFDHPNDHTNIDRIEHNDEHDANIVSVDNKHVDYVTNDHNVTDNI